MFDILSRLKDLAIFQGNLRKKQYFEGWYFKQVGLDDAKLAVIPGVSLIGKDSHAFIQVFDGRFGESYYISFPVVEFKPEKEPFRITVGENRFSYRGLELNINDGVSIHGSIKFSETTPYYSPWYERGVMGWFGYVPFMETNHGVLSLDHKVNGSISINGESHEFKEGRGYIEKDWGTSFPSSWIWMQSNGFKDVGSSFMLSTAVIPWLWSSFIGHLAILHSETETINLSTYRGGKITSLVKTENGVKLTIQTRKHMLKVNAIQGDSVQLKSPRKGLMNGRTIESLNSILDVKLLDKFTDEILFSGIGHDSGLEIMDDKNELIHGLNLF
jgi:hypothetical protein